MLDGWRKTYHDFPKIFWILIFSTFIDRFGGFILFPFFSLYLTEKFEIGMTEVGLVLLMFSLGGMIGSFLGGALSDKFGRKGGMLFGLITSGLGSLLMLFISQLNVFMVVGMLLGILGDIGGPSRQAMMADLLPKKQLSDGYGIMRIVVNIAATIGPIVGGFLAAKSYSYLFIIDAILTMITAIIVIVKVPETNKQIDKDQNDQSIGQTFKGYWDVMKDATFMAFIAISILMILVYMQMYSSMSVFLRDYRGFSPDELGWLLSLNALMVVLTQYQVTRIFKKVPSFITLAIGTAFLGVGFSLFGFVQDKVWIFAAMAILTIGEMIFLPVSQGLAAGFAPADKRGRYMAVFGFSWAIPNLFGALLAGTIIDNYDPNWVWYGAGIVSIITIFGFLTMHKTSGKRVEANKVEMEEDDHINQSFSSPSSEQE